MSLTLPPERGAREKQILEERGRGASTVPDTGYILNKASRRGVRVR